MSNVKYNIMKKRRFKYRDQPSVFKLINEFRVSIEKSRSWLPAFPRNWNETRQEECFSSHKVQKSWCSIKTARRQIPQEVHFLDLILLACSTIKMKNVIQERIIKTRIFVVRGEKTNKESFHTYLTFMRQIKIIYRYCCRLPIVFHAKEIFVT